MIEHTKFTISQEALTHVGIQDPWCDIEASEYPGKWMDEEWCVVITLDPGETMGFCMMAVHPEALYKKDVSILDNIGFWTTGDIEGVFRSNHQRRYSKSSPFAPGEAEAVAAVAGLARLWPCAFIVFEDFVMRKFDQAREFVGPIRFEGAFAYEFWRTQRKYFIYQPGFAKTTVTDKRLRSWGFWDPIRSHPERHQRDATRHALTFFRQLSGDTKDQRWCYNHLFGEGMQYYHEQAFE